MSLHQIKDHQIAQLVNQLREIAVQYHNTQQLREVIAYAVKAKLAETEIKPEQSELTHCPACNAALQFVECSHCGFDTSKENHDRDQKTA
jgi:uncharacterized protein with PIN domain